MKCPFCNHADTQVVETRLTEDGLSVRRRRQCSSCIKRFTTFERTELSMPTIVKRDGRRVEFMVNKLRESINIALRKRPVETQLVDNALARIQAKLRNLGVREVPSLEIGEAVMLELKELDIVAFIRYASVYRSIENAEAFKSLLEQEVLSSKN